MDLGNQCEGGTIVRFQGKKLTVQKNPLGDKEEVVWLGTTHVRPQSFRLSIL